MLGAAKPVEDDKLHTFPHLFVVFVQDVKTPWLIALGGSDGVS